MNGVPDMSGNVPSAMAKTVNTQANQNVQQNIVKQEELKPMTMCEYLKHHIIEELEGAKDYMMKAVEYRIKNPEWAKNFYRMSEMETKHANCLSKMFNSMEGDDLCHAEMYQEIMEAYNSNMLEVSNLKQLYYS